MDLNMYNIINNNCVGRGADIHSMTIFFELLNIVHEKYFLNKKILIILVPSSYFPLLYNFIIHHY
jgi:hypothetical protein